jgi:hypothetical protein
MSWPIATVGMLLWVGVWLCLASKYTATKEGDALVQAFSRLLPAFVVMTCLIVFAATPARKSALSLIILWLHHMSFWLLFVFLIAGQYFQVEAWWKIRSRMSRQSVGATYRRFWILTEIVPAPVALMIFLTGLRLIWQASGNIASPNGRNPLSAFWLQALIIGFSLFFWDGIFGYTPIVRGLRKSWETESGPAESRPQAPLFIESIQLLIHLLSWPLVFLVGVFRWDFPTVLTSPIEGVEHRLSFLPIGWPEVTMAIVLWLSAGLFVSLVRFYFKLVTHHNRVSINRPKSI